MITDAQARDYHDKGFIVVPSLVKPAEIAEITAAAEAVMARAKDLDKSDDVLDLDDAHTRRTPLVRRIKNPNQHHEVFARLMRHARILDVLEKLLGPDIRFHHSKLNNKTAGGGAAVEWHQDWAFYPHTNDDVLAVGIYLDDCGLDNGPLLCLPGSHKGPTHDHHADGAFCGAMDPTVAKLDYDKAEPLYGPAGSITVHHARTVHGSAPNRSNRARRLYLMGYTAADAWPLLGVPDFAAYEAMMVRGKSTLEPRVVPAPIRVPFPVAKNQGSIYENQKELKHRFFDENGSAGRRAAE
jgi:ectoine hydroxylase-related dioxygenase (phytanoyl-CoA dioxygenase family)